MSKGNVKTESAKLSGLLTRTPSGQWKIMLTAEDGSSKQLLHGFAVAGGCMISDVKPVLDFERYDCNGRLSVRYKATPKKFEKRRKRKMRYEVAYPVN